MDKKREREKSISTAEELFNRLQQRSKVTLLLPKDYQPTEPLLKKALCNRLGDVWTEAVVPSTSDVCQQLTSLRNAYLSQLDDQKTIWLRDAAMDHHVFNTKPIRVQAHLDLPYRAEAVYEEIINCLHNDAKQGALFNGWLYFHGDVHADEKWSQIQACLTTREALAVQLRPNIKQLVCRHVPITAIQIPKVLTETETLALTKLQLKYLAQIHHLTRVIQPLDVLKKLVLCKFKGIQCAKSRAKNTNYLTLNKNNMTKEEVEAIADYLKDPRQLGRNNGVAALKIKNNDKYAVAIPEEQWSKLLCIPVDKIGNVHETKRLCSYPTQMFDTSEETHELEREPTTPLLPTLSLNDN